MDKNTNSDALIAEYNAIKNEIISIDNMKNTLYIFEYTSVGAILSFALQYKNPYISFVAFFVLICVKCRIIYYRDTSMIRYTYARDVLEHKLNLDSSIMKFTKVSRISKLQYFSSSFMAFGSFMVFLLYNPQNIIASVMSFVLMLIVISLDIFYIISIKTISKNYEDTFSSK